MSDTVGCLRLTIPSVRSLRDYTCASCSNNHTTTNNTTNKVNKRTNIVVPPNRELSLSRGNPPFLFYGKSTKSETNRF